MNCHTYRKRYVDQWSLGHDPMHDLDLSTHASACAACSRFAGQMLQTITALGSSPNIQPPEGYKEKVMKQILAAQQASNSEAQPLRRRYAALGWAVAVAALAIITIPAGIIPKIGGTGLAFSQVVQRIQQIKTLTFKTVMTFPPGEGAPEATRRLYKAPHLYRQEWARSGAMHIVDTQARKILHCFPKTKTYFFVENISPRYPINMLDRIAEIKADTIETLPAMELAGHKVIGFKAPLPGRPSTAMVTIWADVKTGNPVQVEFKHNSGNYSVWSDFQFNVPLDDAFFSLTPPEGYTFQAQ